MSPDPEDIARVQRSQRSRANVRAGEQAQMLVGHLLLSRGLVAVERIETGMRPVRKWDPRARRSVIIGGRHVARVSGDWRAMLPGSARTVLVEVKKRVDDQLSLSDFEAHQLVALQDYHRAGAIALVGWVHGGGPELLRWPIDGFLKGHPLNRGDERAVLARWAWRAGDPLPP